CLRAAPARHPAGRAAPWTRMLGRSRSYGSTAMPPASSIFAPGVLEGRTALITGGGTGLGKAAARELLACGARVGICGRRSEVLEAACAELGEGGGGMVVNVTLSPHHGLPGMTHSSAARAAVEGLTRELAEAWAPDDVAVCAVAAGHFETEAIQKYPESVKTGAARSVPLGRLG